MDDAVAVALVFGADVRGRFGDGASPAARGLSRVWREEFLSLFKSPAYAREPVCLFGWRQRNAHLRCRASLAANSRRARLRRALMRYQALSAGADFQYSI